MTYRITLKSGPRLLIIVAILVLLPVTAVTVFFVFGVLAGLLALAIAAYLEFQLTRFLRLQLASHVTVDESGAHCVTSTGEVIDFTWEDITHAGVCTATNRHRTAFLYDEERDKLVAIPDSFSHLDEFIAEVQKFVTLGSYKLRPDESVRAMLRGMIVDKESADDEDEDDDDEQENHDDQRKGRN